MRRRITNVALLIGLAVCVPNGWIFAEVRQIRADEPAPFNGVLLDAETFEAYFEAYEMSQSISGLLFRLVDQSELTVEELSQFEYQIRRYGALVELMEEEARLLEERYTVELERRERVEGWLRMASVGAAVSIGVTAGILVAVLVVN